eukprot:TRINITY_DN89645_c0_g1_i1.p1 TRINITY_DN89645_c0_g1~~TRINITY_DN89645_c0_g1_i1.p1  ORF type:complete len:353 (-),score=203.28 TRINITY_DN89645_c0_g1_i1:45-1103(-)
MSTKSDARHAVMLSQVEAAMSKLSPEAVAAMKKDDEWRQKPVNPMPDEDLKGKLFVITGANTGIGYHTAQRLAANRGKPTVVVAARSVVKGQEAVEKIRKSAENDDVHFVQLDLSSLESVDAFVERFRAKFTHISVLINNAGIMATPYAVSPDGYELQFAVCHLGHFRLTTRLLDMIDKDGRILNLSSDAHRRTSFDEWPFESFEKPVEEKEYDPWATYCTVKAANVLFTLELQKRVDDIFPERNIVCAAVHPGFVRTNLQRNIGLEADDYARVALRTPLSPRRGADNSFYVATCPKIPKAQYWDNTVAKAPNGKTLDEDAQKKLWELSERLVERYEKAKKTTTQKPKEPEE